MRAVDNRPYGEVGDCAATHRQKLAGTIRFRQEGLLFEECHGNGAGAYVGTDGTANLAGGNVVAIFGYLVKSDLGVLNCSVFFSHFIQNLKLHVIQLPGKIHINLMRVYQTSGFVPKGI